jgi:hypothetical protein
VLLLGLSGLGTTRAERHMTGSTWPDTVLMLGVFAFSGFMMWLMLRR